MTELEHEPTTTAIERKRTGRPLDIDRVERGLTAIAMAGGNCARAAADLVDIPERTLSGWRREYPERYAEIRATRAAEIDRQLTAEFRDLALQAQQAAEEAVALERQRIQTGDIKDAAGSARNLATTAAIAVDKTRILEDKPTSIVQHRTADEILQALDSRGWVESTAEPIDSPEDP